MTPSKTAQWATAASLIALLLLCVAWELWLAPVRPGGSWLALKALPLALPLGGVLSGRRYTFQWLGMLILPYFVEGVMRAWADRSVSQGLAAMEVALSLLCIAAAIAYVRLTRPPPHARADAGDSGARSSTPAG